MTPPAVDRPSRRLQDLTVISLAVLANLDHRLVGVHSYDQYLTAVEQLGLDHASLQQAYRRMVFNVAAVNRDDHAKNFAFLRTRQGGWSLAPAFDVIHSYRPGSEWTRRPGAGAARRSTPAFITALGAALGLAHPTFDTFAGTLTTG